MGCASSKQGDRGGHNTSRAGHASAYATQEETPQRRRLSADDGGAEAKEGSDGLRANHLVGSKSPNRDPLTIQSTHSTAFDSDDDGSDAPKGSETPQGRHHLQLSSSGALTPSNSLTSSSSSMKRPRKKTSLISSPSMKGKMCHGSGGGLTSTSTVEEQAALADRREKRNTAMVAGADDDDENILLEDAEMDDGGPRRLQRGHNSVLASLVADRSRQ